MHSDEHPPNIVYGNDDIDEDDGDDEAKRNAMMCVLRNVAQKIFTSRVGKLIADNSDYKHVDENDKNDMDDKEKYSANQSPRIHRHRHPKCWICTVRASSGEEGVFHEK